MHPRSGILLVNLGTPDSPHPKDVHRYLIEFLTDGRVIDLPWWKRQLLVRTLIVPKRYRQSAASYKSIWTDEGSPLMLYGRKLQTLLQHKLGPSYHVELGMRYQNPSIRSALASLSRYHLEEIIILPLFPHYASATTGSVHQKVMEELKHHMHLPKITFINSYATDPGLIKAFASLGKSFAPHTYDHILFSFHGLPQRQIKKNDKQGCCLQAQNACCRQLNAQNHSCYSAQCYATAREIAASLDLSPDNYSVAFQSRLGKEPWLEPFTNETIKHLAQTGKHKILVFCPSFVCDCLETLYEIGIEYAHEFKLHGGKTLDLVPGLNDHPAWVDALENLILKSSHLR